MVARSAHGDCRPVTRTAMRSQGADQMHAGHVAQVWGSSLGTSATGRRTRLRTASVGSGSEYLCVALCTAEPCGAPRTSGMSTLLLAPPYSASSSGVGPVLVSRANVRSGSALTARHLCDLLTQHKC